MSIPGFDNTAIFPEDISRETTGGPEFSTEVVTVGNGTEQRNEQWQNVRFRWDVVYGVKSWADLNALYKFFMARKGRARAFRFLDPFDHSIVLVEQTLLTDGPVTYCFQFTKAYLSEVGGTPYLRKITKPIQASGTDVWTTAQGQIVEGVGYTVDYETGIVSLAANPGAHVLASCDFHVPSRFDVDTLSIRLKDYASGDTSVPIVGLQI